MIDWFKIVTDLEKTMSLDQIGREVGKHAATIFRYKQGSEPKHSIGVRLLALHTRVTES